MTITKAERTELRSLVRRRFKLLHAEVDQRVTELQAELERGISERYAAADKAWGDAVGLVHEAVKEANRAANDVMRAAVPDWPTGHDKELVGCYEQNLRQPTKDRADLRYQGQRRISAQAQAARLRLDQQEAELLTRLAMGALESDAAREFLTSIPTVSELVPAVRLRELEQSLSEGGSATW